MAGGRDDKGDATEAVPSLVPARMLNEYAYCPRLCYLEWVQGDFRDSADTLHGSHEHRRVDAESGAVPAPGEMEEDARLHATSVTLSAPVLGMIARIDLLEGEGGAVTPVDYKRGKKPNVPEGAWEPERVQVCAQGLILRENGYRTDGGVIYFTGSKSAVPVPFDEPLMSRTVELLEDMKATARAGAIPPPLEDSRKCPRCSLVGICLPDEVNLLRSRKGAGEPRRLVPARDDVLPVYVQEQGARVGKTGEQLAVHRQDATDEKVRLLDASQLAVFGNVQVTAQALRELCARGIPVCHFTYGGWFFGITQGMSHKNVALRQRQYAVAADAEASLRLARRFAEGKIRNCRTMLRRNHADPPKAALDELSSLARRALRAGCAEELLGLEGNAGRVYFMHFAGMLKPDRPPAFDFRERNRRPPRDPVNALLSFVYALMAKDVAVTVLVVGFDPFLGFYHRPRYGRPSLALDLMEEFRPIVGDSVVIGLVNNGQVNESDFVHRAGACALRPEARRTVIRAYERRLDTLIKHPVFRYTISYRRVLEVQARLLARHLAGEIAEYPTFRTR